MNYLNYTISDFIQDEYFQKWVLNPDEMTNNFWKNWLLNNPDKKDIIDQASYFIRLFGDDKNELSQQNFDAIWQKIIQQRNNEKSNHSINTLKSRRKYIVFYRVAAIFIGLMVATVIGFNRFENTKEIPKVSGNEITLKLDDGTIRVIDELGKEVITNREGEIVVNHNDNVLNYQEIIANAETLRYNELTVPYGKKFELTFSDGSHAILNSGSKLKYPVRFLPNQPRDVFLDGEAYFSVKKDEFRPFTVITNEMNTQVYGTSFNVSSYRNENNTSTVLVEGSVGVYKAKNVNAEESITITPGQRAIFNDGIININKVNINKHIAWKDGELMFINDNFDLILKELERHYNVKIENQFSELNKKRFTGTFKKEPLGDILNIFKEYTAFKYTFNKDNTKVTIQSTL